MSSVFAGARLRPARCCLGDCLAGRVPRGGRTPARFVRLSGPQPKHTRGAPSAGLREPRGRGSGLGVDTAVLPRGEEPGGQVEVSLPDAPLPGPWGSPVGGLTAAPFRGAGIPYSSGRGATPSVCAPPSRSACHICAPSGNSCPLSWSLGSSPQTLGAVLSQPPKPKSGLAFRVTPFRGPSPTLRDQGRGHRQRCGPRQEHPTPRPPFPCTPGCSVLDLE